MRLRCGDLLCCFTGCFDAAGSCVGLVVLGVLVGCVSAVLVSSAMARISSKALSMITCVVRAISCSHSSFCGESSCRYCCRCRLLAFFFVGLREPELKRGLLVFTLCLLTSSPLCQACLMLRSVVTTATADLSLLMATILALAGSILKSWLRVHFSGHCPKMAVEQQAPVAMPSVACSQFRSVSAALSRRVREILRRSSGAYIPRMPWNASGQSPFLVLVPGWLPPPPPPLLRLYSSELWRCLEGWVRMLVWLVVGRVSTVLVNLQLLVRGG
jgi:hypothetical protein